MFLLNVIWSTEEQTNHHIRVWAPFTVSLKARLSVTPPSPTTSDVAPVQLCTACAGAGKGRRRVCVSVCQSASQPDSPVQLASWCHRRLPTRTTKVTPQWGRLGVGIKAEHLKDTSLLYYGRLILAGRLCTSRRSRQLQKCSVWHQQTV